MQPDDDKTRTHVTLTGGTMVSHYRIVEKIGAGGMGEVYLAEDTELNRKVALKFLPSHLCQDADCRARFKREAQAAAKLDHPNIVSVFEVDEIQGRPFFSMQHVEGQSLKDVLAGKALPLDRILELGIQVCEGLQAAHESGITHRDIKPSNILIDSHGRARIVDFGLASVKGSDHLTKTGSTLGTIGYMSPEQVRGHKVDERTDLFSFGVVLYEMITGHAPFKADSEAATLHAIANVTPEMLARFRRDVPVELQAICDKALDKHIRTRYQHADDMAADLKKLSSAAVRQQAPRRDLWNRYVVTAAVAVILALAGYRGMTGFLTEKSKKPEATRKMLAVLPFENLGSPEDEYFADGITDEITSKLATIRELGVISRTSTMQYKNTTKHLREVAKELGVDYVLEGTIRWDKGGDTNRVRILPQLIRVSDDTHLWVETYERPMSGVFAVQADIAGRIAEAMNLTLGAPEVAALSEMPTQNLEAYQAYLRGLDYFNATDYTRAQGRLAVQMFERAVRLDSTFVLAYAYLALVHSQLYGLGLDASEARLAQAKLATDRALALAPQSPRAHQALANYYYWGFRDYERTLRELEYVEVGIPNDPWIANRKAFIHARQGRSREALEELRRAVSLDPRDASVVRELADLYCWLHEYELGDQHYDQSIAIAPDQTLAFVYKAYNYYTWRGDTAAAQATLAETPDQNADDTRLAWVLHHVLTRDYNAALGSLTFSRPNARILMWSGIVYSLFDSPEQARTCFDSARTVAERGLAQRSKDYEAYSDLGIIYAGLGRKDDAIRAGEQAVKLLPVTKDAFYGPVPVGNLALICIKVGEYDAALDQIEYLLSIPNYVLSAQLLRLDPRYDPLRSHPRFQKLLQQSDKVF